MAEGRMTLEWNQTSVIQATLINGNPHRKNKKLVQPHELNPMSKGAPKGIRKLKPQEWHQMLQGFGPAVVVKARR